MKREGIGEKKNLNNEYRIMNSECRSIKELGTENAEKKFKRGFLGTTKRTKDTKKESGENKKRGKGTEAQRHRESGRKNGLNKMYFNWFVF